VIVWVSGGKDSAVTLALACFAAGADRVIPVYRALVRGLRCIEAPIRTQLRMFHVKRQLMVVTDPDAVSLHAEGTLSKRPGSGQGGSYRLTELADLVRHRARAPEAWSASGERRTDSWARSGMFKQLGCGVAPDRRWLYPVWDWSADQVRAHVRLHRLPLAPTWGQGASTGFRLDANCLGQLRAKWPRDYARAIEQYPLAGAILAREEQRQRIPAPEAQASK
jgi:3'-phosphoadenosine 5'-phosphosulfate sulfotransferase (PAPS reductase)/FAD synthetase